MGFAQRSSTPLTPRSPGSTVAFCPDGKRDVGTLLADAGALASQLPAGRYAINLNTNRYDYLLGFCAAMMAGHCTLMPSNRQPATLAELEQAYPESYRLSDDECSAMTGRPEACQTVAAPEIDEERSAIIAFTSGSTGKPVATVKNWRALHVSTQHNFKVLLNGIAGTANLVATVPSQHMWGFETSVLIPLLCDAAITFRNPLYPLDIATALAEVPSPRVLISSPLHLRTLMRSEVSLPGLSRILTATAPLSMPEALELEEHFDAELIDAFGCTESGVIATRRTARERAWTLAPPFSLVPAKSGTEIYAGHLPEPVVLPDRVELLDERSFKWLGRDQDMINIAGKRGSLADLNNRLVRIDGVDDGVIFHPPKTQRLAALVVAPKLEANDVLNALRAQMEPAFIPRPLLLVDQLPRQATGKLSQSALIEMFETLRHKSGDRKDKPSQSA